MVAIILEIEIFYKLSINGGTSFGNMVNLSNNAGSSGFPDVAASGNNVCVMWSDSDFGNVEIFYRRSTDGGMTFGPIDNLSNNGGFSNFPAIAALENSVYVVWQDQDAITEDNEILYRKSTDGGTHPTPSRLRPCRPPTRCRRPQLQPSRPNTGPWNAGAARARAPSSTSP